MHSSRRLVPAAAVALTLGLLTGACGSSDDEMAAIDSKYCSTAKKYQDVFTDDGTGLGLVTNIAKLTKMAAVAPDDLQDEWQTFLDALEGLGAAISKVGLKPGDFVDAVPPGGISASDKVTIATAADRLSQEDVVDAASGIEQEAKDVCKLQFGLS